MLGNLDIWTVVVPYFSVSVTNDSQEEIATKRCALLRVALLSRTLTSLALDGLWRSMTSLEPVCKAVNSCCTSDETLAFQQDNFGGYWILRKPLTEEQRACALGYLSRIQDFHVQPTEARELTLWSMLVASLGLGVTTPLLPKLRSLSFDLRTTNSIGYWLQSALPLMSPMLRKISYTGSSAHVGGVEIFQNMLKSQSLEPTHITYQGYPSPNLLQRCALFDGLESLSLEFDFERQSIQRYTQSPVTIADILNKLYQLKDLRIDLRLFPLRDTASPGERPKFAVSPVLHNLCITGNPSDLQEFLDAIMSPSVVSLSIIIAQAHGLVWKTLCDRTASSFPQMQCLSLEAVSHIRDPPLLMQDLSPIVSRMTMKSFRLQAISHCLPDKGITGLVNSWPELRTLAILEDDGVFFSAMVLVELSQLSHLRELMLPLNLTDLQAPLPMKTPITDCPLTELSVTKYSSAPTDWDGRINLAKNISMLFPMLNHLSGTVPWQQTYISELSKLVHAIHSAVAIQAHRRAMRDRRDKREKWAPIVGVKKDNI